MKRLLDLLLAVAAAGVATGPMLLIAIAIKVTSRGPILYWSDRIGRNNMIFRMPKFRTMRTDAPQVASHLLDKPEAWLTPLGNFLRRTSLDELPQIWSILKGDMTLVGPRPALYNQHDLVELRTRHGIHSLVPGLTGWAQINGRDELPIPLKVELDTYYLRHQSFAFDLRILFLTAWKVILREGTTVPGSLRTPSQANTLARILAESGEIWFRQRDYDRAISDLSQALSLLPTAALFNQRGKAWAAKGRMNEAITDFSQALELDPEFAEAFFNRAKARNAQGATALAEQDFAHAALFDPQFATLGDRLAEHHSKVTSARNH